MASRIDVQYTIADTRSQLKLRQFTKLGLSGKLSGVTVVDSYVVDASLSQKELLAAAGSLANPLVEKAFVNTPVRPGKFEWVLEIGYLPGVTDNVGHTARETIEDLLKTKFKYGESVYTSRVYFLSGKISRTDVKKIADSLFNPLIQRARIKTAEQVKRLGLGTDVPKVKLGKSDEVLSVDLNISKNELISLGKEGVKDSKGKPRGPLALDLDYLLAIKNHFKTLGRQPTDIELETLAQTWSEHCKHTIFASPLDEVTEGLYKGYIKKATQEIRGKKGKKDFCASVFTDNSGAIIFDDQFLISHKVETHNSPSALDPFGGAITGIVGVNRDCIGFGMGAKPVINTYGFCFAPLAGNEKLYRDKTLQNPLLAPERILEGVVAGVNAGGNCSGIPTPQGFVFFDERYRGKPLVFAGTVGLIPKKIGKKFLHQKFGKPGDYILMAGGRVGLDGIHGATFSSGSLNEKSPATAVQIGDPITQKKLSDALIKEARDAGLYSSITDCGAGGLSSAIAEMAKEVGGCEVELNKVPLKYPGLDPWQIWISESQERMILAVPKVQLQKLQTLLKERGVESTVIGKFTDSGKCVVKYQGKKVVDLGLEFLHNGLPERKLKSKETRVKRQEISFQAPSDLSETVKQIIARPNIASFSFISEQYDHEVQSGSALKPLQGRGRINAQATVTRPVINSNKGVVLANGYNPWYSEIDSYNMAASSIDTAIRNAVACGGNVDHMALLDNFCWSSSNDPERLYQLKMAAKACYNYAVSYGTPFISGKDSMFNDFSGFNEKGKAVKISAPPTLLISSIGVVDANKVVSEDVKFSGDLVYILGETFAELGGSEYFSMQGAESAAVPGVDAAKNLKLYRKLHKAINLGLVASSISVGRGGLAAALTKMSIGGKLGVDISLGYLPGEVMRDDFTLFSESQGRIVVTVDVKNKEKFEAAIAGSAFANIGKVGGGNILIRNRISQPVVQIKVEDVAAAYHSTFKDF